MYGLMSVSAITVLGLAVWLAYSIIAGGVEDE